MPTSSNERARIDERSLNGRCLIIGEVAQAHDGSLGMAHAFIDAIAAAGADAVKFQTHIATAESTAEEPWRVNFSVQDQTRYAYWKRMEFSEAQWVGLKEHAEKRNLLFISSPFSVEAAELLERVGVAAWKIASGEVGNCLLFDYLAKTDRPVILSTGMSPLSEVDGAVRWLRRRRRFLTVLQCTSRYPCPHESVGLNVIPFFRERYRCPVGLSDHSGTIYPGLAAAALGIEALEVHVTLSREMFGPDVSSSVTASELRQLVEGVRFIEKMRTNPVDKTTIARVLAPMREAFTKSVVARQDLPSGTVLQERHLALKKPGAGIPPSALPDLVGRRLRRGLRADQRLQFADLEEAC